jgi:hypothetical protein
MQRLWNEEEELNEDAAGMGDRQRMVRPEDWKYSQDV